MQSNEIRQKFLEFFKEKGHAIIPSASLMPENDPTTLFNSAGMQPLVPYLMGEKHPLGDKLVDVQKCLRTDDIDEVGDASHFTFFEMLGNWSLGSYFKKEAIEWSWEFLTDKKWLGLDPSKIAVSVFAGDDDAPRDEESAQKWLEVSDGALEGRIDYLPKKKNWWGPAGETGPCGPCTEIFYWVGDELAPKEIKDSDLVDHPRWMEIWNNVFMSYNKTADKKFEPLKQKNVDTGMGLERITMVMEGKNSAYETELFAPIMKSLESKVLSLKTNDQRLMISKRIIADHIKASVFLMVDGVMPSNTGRGYVLRRLIRRAIRHGKLLGIEKGEALLFSRTDIEGNSSKKQRLAFFLPEIATSVIEIYKNIYSEVEKNKEKIFEELKLEEEKFNKTLENGLKELERMGEKISAQDAFMLFTTYGFPLEMIDEEIKKYGLKIDKLEFENLLKQHQKLSKTASAGMFKGGLADAGEQTTKYHTATHLLLASMRDVLGPEIYQKGSNITAERLRFDFNYPRKLTDGQIKEIEDLVNQKIQKNLPVEMMEMPKEEALKLAKVSFDPSKYGDIVKIYKIADFSTELCGGPHVKSTGELGKFKITKEEASSAGIRRIKAVLE